MPSPNRNDKVTLENVERKVQGLILRVTKRDVQLEHIVVLNVC